VDKIFNMNMTIKVATNFVHGFNLPQYETSESAGMDIRANITECIIIKPGHTEMIPTGIKMAIPSGYELQIRPRSGLAAKYGVTVCNSPGTIDADFRGEVKVILINHGLNEFIVNPGDRIAQAVLNKFERIEWKQVDTLENTARGEGGFGSTGIK